MPQIHLLVLAKEMTEINWNGVWRLANETINKYLR